AGYFSWSLFWPFAIASVPAAYLGGRLGLPSPVYKAILGVVLLFASWRLFRSARQGDADAIRPPHRGAALFSGGVIGVLSGLTGVGGGIFLSPLMLLMKWARTRESSGVAALFILVNSIAALLGDPASLGRVTGEIALWMPAAVIGGWIGAEYGSKRLATPMLRQCLAAVLVVAGIKLIAT
ncbi:MAG: sulfite exporter TauE/SafE family protein, partial [Cytophagaceae bacterium]|nr:sulfite exporter TauE/SafE family protein [Gemmatimonadaceae bacterium]